MYAGPVFAYVFVSCTDLFLSVCGTYTRKLSAQANCRQFMDKNLDKPMYDGPFLKRSEGLSGREDFSIIVHMKTLAWSLFETGLLELVKPCGDITSSAIVHVSALQVCVCMPCRSSLLLCSVISQSVVTSIVWLRCSCNT